MNFWIIVLGSALVVIAAARLLPARWRRPWTGDPSRRTGSHAVNAAGGLEAAKTSHRNITQLLNPPPG
ncbi:hypothetical protein [Nocardioides speluncae]|uniref:hypothetical protein n=1 Tax=Nocardioides speluncae TaxID=2670337 RepID=UPI000D68BC17|nr:hypothetical protein [Nocardioides speluncae]